MKTVTVKILDCDYRLRTSEAGEALLVRAQEIVDARMRETKRQFPHQPLVYNAIVSCLDLVGEFLEEETRQNRQVKQRLRQLIDKLKQI